MVKKRGKKLFKVTIGQQYKEFTKQRDAKLWTKQLVDADIYFIIQEKVYKK